MDNSIPFYIQQIKELSKWYFGHEVQVITFIDQATGNSHVVVYPDDCNLVSGHGREIHLHASGGSYWSVHTVLEDIQRRIGKCFRVGVGTEVPILQECEAPCKCLQQTVSLAMARDGGDGRRVQMGSAPVADLDKLSGVRDIDTGSCTSGTEANTAQALLPVLQKIQNTLEGNTAQALLPVLQKIQNTLEAIEQRMSHCPVETSPPGSGNGMDLRAEQSDATVHSPVPVVNSTAHRTLSGRPGGSSVSLEDPEPKTKPAAPHSTTSSPASESTSGAQMTVTDFSIEEFGPPRIAQDEAYEHTRDIVRDEIGRVLAGAMGSLARKGAEI